MEPGRRLELLEKLPVRRHRSYQKDPTNLNSQERVLTSQGIDIVLQNRRQLDDGSNSLRDPLLPRKSFYLVGTDFR
jgi:hypothetical protein